MTIVRNLRRFRASFFFSVAAHPQERAGNMGEGKRQLG